MTLPKFVCAGVFLVVTSVAAGLLTSARSTDCGSHLPGPGYYIAAHAKLITDELVLVYGASNLPEGAVLTIEMQDYVGEGSTTLAGQTRASVGADGLFKAEMRPEGKVKFYVAGPETPTPPVYPGTGHRGHLKVRGNMVCVIVFSPNYPRQPENVTRLVGADGDCLKHAGNPQVQSNSRVTLLWDETIVTE